MPYLHLIDEAIGLIDNEIRIVEWRIKYPEQFKRQLDKPPLSRNHSIFRLDTHVP